MVSRLVALVAMAAAMLVASASASAAIVPGRSVDGPSTDIVAVGNVDVAPDGTGAVVYVKKDGAVDRVFVSRIANGAFGPPQRVAETNFASNPRVAASNGGKLVVVFVTADGMANHLRSAISAGTGQPFVQSPVEVTLTAWLAPHVDANPAGQAYVTATEFDVNADVYAFRLNGTTWSPVGAKLDNNAANEAGGSMPQDQPRIAVTADGNAVVAWPEKLAGVTDDQVYARRLTGTTAGAAVPAAIPTLGGRPRGDTANMPDLDAEGNAAWLAFRENFKYGAAEKGRILVRRFAGGTFGAAQVVDGLPNPTNDGAEQPSLSVNDAGQGIVGNYRQTANELWGARLAGGTWSPASRLDRPPTDNKTFPAAAIGGNGAGMLAFDHRPDNTTDSAIQGRPYVNGAFGALRTLSNPALGAAGSPTASADADGNVAVAWKQGAAANSRIVVAIVDGPPPPAGGGTTPPPPPPPGDTTDPLLTSASLSRTRFAVGRGAPRLLATGRRRRAPVGTRIRFTLTEASRVTFSFRRAVKGRRVGRRCVKATKRNRGRRRCTRLVRAGSFARQAPAGRNVVRFSGRLNRRKKLKLGRHRLTLRPRDAAGNAGKAVRKRFRVVRRR